MRPRLVLGLLVLAFPAQAHAARFDQAPPTYNQTGAPLTFVLHGDGNSASSGVAYKLSSETAWHRCLPLNSTITLTLPAGDYTIQIADDSNRAWFDQNLPQSQTPECSETTAPLGRPISSGVFYVRNPPVVPARPSVKPVADRCGLELTKVSQLHRQAETAQDRYQHRRGAARRRAWKKADAAYRTARRAFDKHC
jgi:hypothetical protein